MPPQAHQRDAARRRRRAGYEQEINSLRANARDFHDIAIDTSDQTVGETVAAIRTAIPAIYE